jgi:hypothetical protein
VKIISSRAERDAPEDLEPTDEERQDIEVELRSVEMPTNVPFPAGMGVPPEVSQVLEKRNTTVTTFKTLGGAIQLYLVRKDKTDGGKGAHSKRGNPLL